MPHQAETPAAGDGVLIRDAAGGPAPPPQPSRAPEEHGRGNSIVALVATGHGSCTHPGGTTYWADL
ncbi:hypothetical protein [Kitasatospora sp. NPDC005748]|uniref:hypothetical protein n=1 Tax=Kitasatospora sp. NPDC005748 TaxID=3157063 RepID=UPI0033E47D1F